MKRRRAILGVIALIGVAAASGAGTFAYLSDEGSTDLSFVTGSLEVENDPQTLDFGDVAEDTVTADMEITNSGSLPARQVVWSDVTIDGSVQVAKAMEVTTISYRGENITSDVQSQISGSGNGNGILDLHDVATYLNGNEIDVESLVGGDGLDPESNEAATLSISARVDYSQGISEDSMGMQATVEVLGRQDSP